MKSTIKFLCALSALALLSGCSTIPASTASNAQNPSTAASSPAAASSSDDGTLSASKVLYGIGEPTAAQGSSGSFYIDLESGIVYIKAGESWNKRNRLGGPAALSGTAAPSETLGFKGDTYLNTANWDFYVREDNGWVKKGTLGSSTNPTPTPTPGGDNNDPTPTPGGNDPTPTPGGDDSGTGESGEGDPTIVTSVTYDFSGLDDGASMTPTAQGIEADSLLSVLKSSVTGEDIITEASGEKVYYANTADGPKVKGVKFSSSKVNGSLSLTLSKAVTGISIKVYGWNAKEIEAGSKISVNGSEKDLTDNDLTGSTLNFTFQSSSTITIQATKRFVITQIAF